MNWKRFIGMGSQGPKDDWSAERRMLRAKGAELQPGLTDPRRIRFWTDLVNYNGSPENCGRSSGATTR
jgi:hypothetical protein